jgi:hypothetical protein
VLLTSLLTSVVEIAVVVTVAEGSAGKTVSAAVSLASEKSLEPAKYAS